MLDFSSERQRMSVIVRAVNDGGAGGNGDDDDDEITLYCKGADARVLGMLAPPSGAAAEEDERHLTAAKSHIHRFACEGLRTLVVAKRTLTRAEWTAFDRQYQAVGASVDSDKEEKLEACMSEMERGLRLVAVTGIEDKLQEGKGRGRHFTLLFLLFLITSSVHFQAYTSVSALRDVVVVVLLSTD